MSVPLNTCQECDKEFAPSDEGNLDICERCLRKKKILSCDHKWELVDSHQPVNRAVTRDVFTCKKCSDNDHRTIIIGQRPENFRAPQGPPIFPDDKKFEIDYEFKKYGC